MHEAFLGVPSEAKEEVRRQRGKDIRKNTEKRRVMNCEGQGDGTMEILIGKHGKE
jgi:hypothetical protein